MTTTLVNGLDPARSSRGQFKMVLVPELEQMELPGSEGFNLRQESSLLAENEVNHSELYQTRRGARMLRISIQISTGKTRVHYSKT